MRGTAIRCGLVKSQYRREGRLTGKQLEFVLEFVGGDPFGDEIARKLKAGEKLGDYEAHMLMDVWLLHLRLGSGGR
jgi:hypothetical protein